MIRPRCAYRGGCDLLAVQGDYCANHIMQAVQAEIDTIKEEQDRDSTPAEDLRAWWLEVARRESGAVIPKAIEYGATDLAEIGRQLITAGVKVPDMEDRKWSISRGIEPYQAELGVYFYILGKMARWTDAVANGRSVSDDTLHDIGVYVRMAQRIREVGAWPGV